MGERTVGLAEGTAVEITHFDRSIHARVIAGSGGNSDVARLRIDVLIAGDCSHFEIAAGEPQHEVGSLWHFDGGVEVVMGSVLDGEGGTRAGGAEVGGRVASIARECDANGIAAAGRTS